MPKSSLPALDIASKALGVFSLALGLAELIAPRRLAKPLGLHRHKNIVRGYGVREIASGLGLLTAKNKTPWLWSRVAGDTVDLATLGAGAWSNKRQRKNIAIAAALVLGVTIIDFLVAKRSGGKFEPMRLIHDYSDRRGFPHPVHMMRGAANDWMSKNASPKKKA